MAFAFVAQFCSVSLIAGMFLKGDPTIIPQLSGRDWLLLTSSSMLGIAWGHMFLYASVQRLGAALTTSCQTSTPFVTAAIAGVMLGEELSPAQWVAGVVIVVGALTLLSIKNRMAEG